MVSLSELIELRMTNWAKAYIYGAAPPYEGGDACVECGPERALCLRCVHLLVGSCLPVAHNYWALFKDLRVFLELSYYLI